MKFTISLERTVELIVEAPNEEAAEKAAKLYMDDDLMWWEASEWISVYEYSGPKDADCTVDENGQDVFTA